MKRILRYTGIGLLGLLGVALLAATAVYGTSEYRLRKTYDLPVSAVALSGDPEVIARGRHLMVTRGCVDCHGENLGGVTIMDDPIVGRISGTNLTRGAGGVAGGYTDESWVTAIRHGLRPDGKPLLFMPSHEFYPLSDEDVGALVAYIKSAPAVDNEVPEHRVGPLARVLLLAGQMDLIPAELIDHEAPRPAGPPAGVTAEYGAYLATGCVGCHGHTYSGGRIPGTPPSFPAVSNITPDSETGIGEWTEADFFRSMREGVRPDGSALDPFMPVQNTRQMTDDELRAIWLYLRTLEPKPEGNR
ncbi:MAG: cytochrome c [Gemmatimonadota bacterium]